MDYSRNTYDDEESYAKVFMEYSQSVLLEEPTSKRFPRRESLILNKRNQKSNLTINKKEGKEEATDNTNNQIFLGVTENKNNS